MNKKKIIVAVTGASGSVYAQKVFERLAQLHEQIEECAVLFSENAIRVWKYEIGEIPDFTTKGFFRFIDNNNMFDAVASGSTGYDSMIVIPCSMGTLGRIACGVSDNLITRAADVMLKEKKTLILVSREAPLNAVHLQNMLTLDRAGAFIFPASPFFYHKPSSLNGLIIPFVDRILEKAAIDSAPFRWTGN